MKAPCQMIEAARVTSGPQATSSADGMNGCFVFVFRGERLYCVASDGSGWKPKNFKPTAFQCVIVTRMDRVPTVEDLTFVYQMFWDEGHIIQEMRPDPDNCVNRFCVYLHRVSRIQTYAHQYHELML